MATISKTKFNTYRVQIRRTGLPPIYQSFKTKEQALAWVRKTEYELDIGTHLSKEDTERITFAELATRYINCLLYTSPSPRDRQKSRMPSSA